MTKPNNMEKLNINTLLLTILLAIGGWTLLRVVALGEAMATTTAAASAQIKETTDIRARLVSAEVQLQANTLAITRLEGKLK